MVNEAAASIIGLPAASLTGHPATNIIPKTKTLLEECFRCVRNGEPLADQQLAWQGRHYQLIFGVLRDQSFIGLTIAVIDVTRRTHIECNLLESRRCLDATTSHDNLTGLPHRRDPEGGMKHA